MNVFIVLSFIDRKHSLQLQRLDEAVSSYNMTYLTELVSCYSWLGKVGEEAVFQSILVCVYTETSFWIPSPKSMTAT